MRDFTWTFALSSPLDIVAANRAEIPAYAAENAARNRPASDWNGWATHEHALTLAESGWTDAPNLSDLAEKIAPTETRQSHEMQHAVTGAFVDVSRFLEGHPECMMEFIDEPAPRHISLAFQLGKHCGITAQQMELAGAVALAVIDSLTRSGFAVGLDSLDTCYSRHISKCSLIRFPLLRPGEPADPNQLAFWLCHPAAFRRLVFGFWDTCPEDFYNSTNQSAGRGKSLNDLKPQEVGVDYILDCSPSTEEQARHEYHRIISEITATL